MALDRKRSAVEVIGADVLVVPECDASPALAGELGVSFAWRGENPQKGLGVFAFGGWRTEPVDEEQPLPWVLPVRVIDPGGVEVAILLAVWTVAHRLDGRPDYAGQVSAAIDACTTALEEGRAVIAGDLNCSAQGPSVARHLENMRRLERAGVRSAYHAFFGHEHGAEGAMTLSWVGPKRRVYEYHCDFLFLPGHMLERLRQVEVGSMMDWIESGLSDHCPVVAELVLSV